MGASAEIMNMFISKKAAVRSFTGMDRNGPNKRNGPKAVPLSMICACYWD